MLQCKIYTIPAPSHTKPTEDNVVPETRLPLRPTMPEPGSRLIPDAVAKTTRPIKEDVSLGSSDDEVMHSSDEADPFDPEESE